MPLYRSHLSDPRISGFILAAAVAAGVLLPATPVALAGETCEAQDVPLFVKYRTTSECEVFPNYPKPGVKGQLYKWTVPAGRNLVWRYNVNNTWAVVSDLSRSNEDFPWWGFTRRDCLGKSVGQNSDAGVYPAGVPVPSEELVGRSHICIYDGWRPVEYHQGPQSIVKNDIRVKRNGTLRDRNHFMVGNVFVGWKVNVTDVTDGHWVYVYSPGARKWGYVECKKLDVDCAAL